MEVRMESQKFINEAPFPLQLYRRVLDLYQISVVEANSTQSRCPGELLYLSL